MTIDKQRIRNVPGNNNGVLKVYVVEVVDDLDTTALAAVDRLDDPGVAFRLQFGQLIEVGHKLICFFWQDIGIRDKIVIIAKFLLSLYIVETKSVLPCNFK